MVSFKNKNCGGSSLLDDRFASYFLPLAKMNRKMKWTNTPTVRSRRNVFQMLTSITGGDQRSSPPYGRGRSPTSVKYNSQYHVNNVDSRNNVRISNSVEMVGSRCSAALFAHTRNVHPVGMRRK